MFKSLASLSLVVEDQVSEYVYRNYRTCPSLVPRPFWEGEMAWQLPRVQTVYGCNVMEIVFKQ